MEEALRVALLVPELTITTPLTTVSKADTFKIADQLGHLDVLVKLSHTCYNGDHKTKWDWGFGCGNCPACQTREAGWDEFMDAVIG
jgi:7-cyano-7-deazaguanine synthase